MTIGDYDNDNAVFWSEPCGTNAANIQNLDLNDPSDVEEFDKWYIRTYPYLFDYLDKLNLTGASVLEIGVGLGTVSRYLVSRSKSVAFVDIAPGALNFVRNTLPKESNVRYFCQSILEIELQETFDFVIAVGSLHHTGDLDKALNVAESLTKKKGTLLIMIYYAFQPRRIIFHPVRTFNEYFRSNLLVRNRQIIFAEQDSHLRAKADSNSAGKPAPYTAFSSRKIFSNRSGVTYKLRLNNFHRLPLVSRFISRDFFLKYFSKYFGCDIYAIGRKSS